MKKSIIVIFVLLFTLSLAACRKEKTTLSVYFVPSRDAAEILEYVDPLADMLQAELAELGHHFDYIDVQVGTSYEAVGEGMDAGTIDVGFLPGGTYAIYSVDGNIDVILTATRDGLNKDYDDAKSWNDGLPTLGLENTPVAYYRSLVIAGPSPAGRALADKVNAGTALTWTDVSSVVWCVRSTSSSAGFIYPTLKLMDMFDGKGLSDLVPANRIETPGYGASMANLAAGNCDVGTFYADARRDNYEKWVGTGEGNFGRTESIWAETDVVLVTEGIFNDTISISKITVDADLAAALQQAFINLINTPEGLAVFDVYSHKGYKIAQDSDYDGARAAQALLN